MARNCASYSVGHRKWLLRHSTPCIQLSSSSGSSGSLDASANVAVPFLFKAANPSSAYVAMQRLDLGEGGGGGMEMAMGALLACQYLNSSSNCTTVSHCPTPMYSISSGDPSSIYGDSFLHKYSVDLGSVSALVRPAPPPSTVPQEPRTSYCESHASLGITHSLISDQWAFR